MMMVEASSILTCLLSTRLTREKPGYLAADRFGQTKSCQWAWSPRIMIFPCVTPPFSLTSPLILLTGLFMRCGRMLASAGFDEVAFSMSLDGGFTWSAPIKVSQTPANSNPLRQQAFLPSVAVNDDNVVGVTYYDFRNDDDSGELADHWFVSCNGKLF